MKIPNLGWAMSPQIIAASALVVGDVWNFNSAMLPSVFSIRAFTSKDEFKAKTTRQDITIGIVAAAGMSLVVGYAVSVVFKSWWPMVFTAGGLAAADLIYVWAVTHPHGHTDFADQ